MQKDLMRPDYYHIPAVVAEAVQPHEAFVWSIVYWFEKMKDGKCKASNQRIAEALPYKSTAKSVGNALDALEKKGLITRVFRDDNKRIRSEVRVTVGTVKVPPTGGTGTTHRWNGVPPTGGQNSKREIVKEELVNSDASASRSPNPPKRSDPERSNATSLPFSLKAAVEDMEANARRDLNIIAYYFRERNPKLQTKEQFMVALRRHLRPAKQLTPFSDAQIVQATKKAKVEYPEWTLETLVKLLTK